MAATMPADMIDEVNARAYERIPALLLEMILHVQRPDGTTYGDTLLTPEQRIARFWSDAKSGNLDALETVRPDLVASDVKQFQKDIRISPLYAAQVAAAMGPLPPLPGVPTLPGAPPLMPAPGVPPVPSIPQMAA